MTERQELVREAFAALDKGELEPFKALLDPDAKWVAIPQGENVAETPTCVDRAAILSRLKRVHESGRRFRVGKR
jgi:ketosteroid isomerase-like protein